MDLIKIGKYIAGKRKSLAMTQKQLTEKIGNFIAQRRKDKKLTQAKLASYLGISDRTISKWERGVSHS